MTEWKQERPTWCPHPDCLFKRRVQDAICGGELREPIPHDEDENTHRVCFRGDSVEECGPVLALQVNKTDLNWFRWIFDAIDGLKTSWLSQREEQEAQNGD